ncbi:MAG: PD40 domain-containing protein [Pyrinomonadaceae bacterium]|nr:PD40 domain-containing protein [Pyrinomonadaceae bacterium]
MKKQSEHFRRGCCAAGRCALIVCLALLLCVISGAGCQQLGEGLNVRPRALRDVPADRLAFRFEPDVDVGGLPASFTDEEVEELLAPIKADFETRRAEERLLRTIVSPDGQRALVLYEMAEMPEGDFRLDLYSSDGTFIRNVLPPDISGTFAQSAAWSPDSQQIAFIGIRNAAAQPTPTPPDPLASPDAALPATTAPTDAAPLPSASAAPLIAPVPTFNTEQIYVGDRDGFGLRPLTTRDGLIYFQFVWAPDAHAVAALACKEDEWNARRTENKTPAGRPRLITPDGRERLLSDNLADTAPAWSPDSSKVATAFDTDVVIYDVLTAAPTAAVIALREPLLTASTLYDARLLQKAGTETTANGNNSAATKKIADATIPEAQPVAVVTALSFNPVVRLEWTQPETLFVQTAFLRIYKTEPVRNYPRWHVLHLSPQAAVLS